MSQICRIACRVSFLFIVGLVTAEHTAGAAPPRVLEAGTRPADARLGPPRRTTDKYHPWAPATTLPAWEAQRQAIRERMLVSLGLWPMPPLAPLQPVVHDRIERDDYTIEKVFMASLPGHYVSGNLYRPKNVRGRVPGVLVAHGHAVEGRFTEATIEKTQQNEIDKGAETYMANGRYRMQSPAVGLVRMGCIVFYYDMVGVADSRQLSHTEAFLDPGATLRLQSSMGLQTLNSMRALDFLLSLPEVDPGRIGMTGSSGGGTQTFVLGALDPRLTAAFPAVMVSTNMQGGCICENACFLRIGINNVAMAALFAPKPLAMSCADDWTIDFQTKGLPELKQVYGLYGHPEFVDAKTWPEFGHNYNQPAREMMYAWFNRHLNLGRPEPISEREFVPVVPPTDLSVYDAEHPLPSDALDAAQLKAQMARVSDEQFAALLPRDATGIAEYRRIVGTAARIMLDGSLPAADETADATELAQTEFDGYCLYRVTLTRRGAGEQIPAVGLVPAKANGTVVLWIDDAGKRHLFDGEGVPTAAVRRLLAAGIAVVSADVFQTGEYLGDGETEYQPPEIPPPFTKFPAHTYGYNRPVVSNRVRDILTVLASLGRHPQFRTVHLVGTGEAGPWALLARALAGNADQRTIADLNGFGFSKVGANYDVMMLPGGLKYGGIGGLVALSVPGELQIFGVNDAPPSELAALKQVYQAANAKLQLVPEPLSDAEVAERLLK